MFLRLMLPKASTPSVRSVHHSASSLPLATTLSARRMPAATSATLPVLALNPVSVIAAPTSTVLSRHFTLPPVFDRAEYVSPLDSKPRNSKSNANVGLGFICLLVTGYIIHTLMPKDNKNVAQPVMELNQDYMNMMYFISINEAILIDGFSLVNKIQVDQYKNPKPPQPLITSHKSDLSSSVGSDTYATPRCDTSTAELFNTPVEGALKPSVQDDFDSGFDEKKIILLIDKLADINLIDHSYNHYTVEKLSIAKDNIAHMKRLKDELSHSDFRHLKFGSELSKRLNDFSNRFVSQQQVEIMEELYPDASTDYINIMHFILSRGGYTFKSNEYDHELTHDIYKSITFLKEKSRANVTEIKYQEEALSVSRRSCA